MISAILCFLLTLLFNKKQIKNIEIEVFKKSFPFKVRFIVFVVLAGAY